MTLNHVVLFCRKFRFYIRSARTRQIDGVINCSRGFQSAYQWGDIKQALFDENSILILARPQIEALFNFWHTAHPNVNYTNYFEEINKTVILHMKVLTRTESTISLVIYRNSTWTGLNQTLHIFSQCNICLH